MLRAKPPYKERGSALLSALFIMTLVAIAATAMGTRLQLDIYRTGLTLTSDKLYLASQAVTFWSMDTLANKNSAFKHNDKEGRLAVFPHNLQHMYPDVITKGALYDLQAQFNLNNLLEKKYQFVFLKLLETTHINMSATQRQMLTNAIVYWLSPYKPGRGQDDYLAFYLSQRPPYIPGYQYMQSMSELRLVKGVNAHLYRELLPSITVLPETTSINIDTASMPVLMSIGNGLSQSEAEEIIQSREQEGIKSMEKLIELALKLNLPRDQITIESNYYLSVAKTSADDLNLITYTVLKRNIDKQGHITVGIVRESLNTM